jgi:hypothetical protein
MATPPRNSSISKAVLDAIGEEETNDADEYSYYSDVRFDRPLPDAKYPRIYLLALQLLRRLRTMRHFMFYETRLSRIVTDDRIETSDAFLGIDAFFFADGSEIGGIARNEPMLTSANTGPQLKLLSDWLEELNLIVWRYEIATRFKGTQFQAPVPPEELLSEMGSLVVAIYERLLVFDRNLVVQLLRILQLFSQEFLETPQPEVVAWAKELMTHVMKTKGSSSAASSSNSAPSVSYSFDATFFDQVVTHILRTLPTIQLGLTTDVPLQIVQLRATVKNLGELRRQGLVPVREIPRVDREIERDWNRLVNMQKGQMAIPHVIPNIVEHLRTIREWFAIDFGQLVAIKEAVRQLGRSPPRILMDSPPRLEDRAVRLALLTHYRVILNDLNVQAEEVARDAFDVLNGSTATSDGPKKYVKLTNAVKATRNQIQMALDDYEAGVSVEADLVRTLDTLLLEYASAIANIEAVLDET